MMDEAISLKHSLFSLEQQQEYIMKMDIKISRSVFMDNQLIKHRNSMGLWFTRYMSIRNLTTASNTFNLIINQLSRDKKITMR